MVLKVWSQICKKEKKFMCQQKCSHVQNQSHNTYGQHEAED